MLDILTEKISLRTKGFNQIIDISSELAGLLANSGMKEGQVTVFVSGSTGALTTIEYEPGLLKDLPDLFEKLIPQNRNYEHDNTWHDGNGFSHLRASLLKPSLTIPFKNSNLLLGTWQQVIFIDFDNKPRQRDLVVQFLGRKK